MRVVKAIAVIAISAGGVAGCAAQAAPTVLTSTSTAAAATAATATSPAAQVVSASKHRSYASLREVLAEADTVVVGTAGAHRDHPIEGFPFTVTEVTVDRVVAGASPGSVVDVLQLGLPERQVPEWTPILVTGQRYLLVLTRYHLVRGDSTGLWTVTGDLGAYRWAGEQWTFAGGYDLTYVDAKPLADADVPRVMASVGGA